MENTMKKLSVALITVLASVWGVSAWAETSCSGPSKNGNTWSLVCSEAGDIDTSAVYQCDYSVTVTNKSGQSNTVSASGTVAQGQSGVVVWSGIESGGSAIVSAVADGGCSLK